MKPRKKILLFLFLLIFLVSNTGLPLSLHLCRMMMEISTDKCDMCSQSETKGCCDSETGERISSGHFSCCQTKMAAEPLKDRFISSKEDIRDNVIFSVPVELISASSEINEVSRYNEIFWSPPHQNQQPIFLRNASILI